MAPQRKKYYAYFVPAENRRGIADEWAECERAVSGKPGARYRAFSARDEAARWLARGAMYEAKPRGAPPELEAGIYFDAGTGRGEGVEVSVTDEKGKNLLHKAISKKQLNRYGKQLLADSSATNNYGELLALKYALAAAKKLKTKKIFGDSRLVVEYWSRWRIKKKELPAATVSLAEEVSRLREEFENKFGGIVARINGAHNPADLGFHRR